MTKFVEITNKNIREGFYINKDGAITDNRRIIENSRIVYDPAMNKFVSLNCFIRYYQYSDKEQKWICKYYPGVIYITQSIANKMESRKRVSRSSKYFIRYRGKVMNVIEYTNEINGVEHVVKENYRRYGGNNVADYYALKIHVSGDIVPVITNNGKYFNSIDEYKKEMGIKVHSSNYNLEAFNHAERS